ncbi:MAG TPA: hypothetical protein VNA14_13330 [Mycobacteriales bacterium]|nr:hypothetical protein [Mycobacteriales bacterium]
MDISNGSRPTSNRESAFLVDYDKSAGGRARAGTPPRKAKPVIDFYQPTPHRPLLVAADPQSRRPGFLRAAVSRLLRRR